MITQYWASMLHIQSYSMLPLAIFDGLNILSRCASPMAAADGDRCDVLLRAVPPPLFSVRLASLSPRFAQNTV